MSNATYCKKDEDEECEHYVPKVGKNGPCTYRRTGGTCKIAGIEDLVTEKKEE
jgi:hypothetical protein